MWENISDWAEKCLSYQDFDGKNAPLKLTPLQRKALDALADNKIVAVCVPKRQGKTLIAAVAALYAAFVLEHSVVIILSTSREHASSVAFRRVKEIYHRSQRTLDGLLAGKGRRQRSDSKVLVSQNRIEVLKKYSAIETVPCLPEAVAGRTYTLLIIDELALIDDEEVAAVAIAQSEQKHARILITSTASSKDHLLYRIYEESQKPNSDICFIYRSGWEFYGSDERNPLVDDKFLERQKMTMIEPLFRRYFLNEFGSVDGDETVFTGIDNCLIDVSPPTDRDGVRRIFPEVTAIAPVAAIDRALPFSKHGDLSAGVLVLKLLFNDTSVKYLVVDAVTFPTGDFDEIWEWILNIHSTWGLERLVLEQYQCYDLYDAARHLDIPTTLVHVNPRNKQDAVNFLHSKISHGELLIPKTFVELTEQMKLIRYKGGHYSAPVGKHDDLFYALLWAVFYAGGVDLYPIFIEFLP